jgi:dTMP kinase
LDRAFHERLRDGFRRIAAAEPQRCSLIDAAGDVPSIYRAILDAVGVRFAINIPR